MQTHYHSTFPRSRALATLLATLLACSQLTTFQKAAMYSGLLFWYLR
jgi:hypothetical protein